MSFDAPVMRQVADADRSPRRNRRVDPLIQRVHQRPKHGQRDTRAALHHPGHANEHDRPHALLVHRRANADGPRAHRVDLETRALFRRQRLAGIRSECRGQSIDGLVRIGRGVDDRTCLPQALDHRQIDADARSARDGDDVGNTGAADARENGVRVDFGTSSPARRRLPSM